MAKTRPRPRAARRFTECAKRELPREALLEIKTYLEAFADLGYKPGQVSKILITHKHPDHTGELRAFPNAETICSAEEAATDEIKHFNPTVATFSDGPYHEFPASRKVAPGVTCLPAARETLDRVRAFCRARPTVYLGTHTPEALESLDARRVVRRPPGGLALPALQAVQVPLQPRLSAGAAVQPACAGGPASARALSAPRNAASTSVVTGLRSTASKPRESTVLRAATSAVTAQTR